MADPRFEDLVEFPTVFVFRALGTAGPGLVDACVSRVAETLGRPVTSHEVKPSSGGKYESVRIAAVVVSADEIRAVYVALDGVDGVRMVL